jgi:uncharacterized protein (DUF302 family)
MKRRLIALLAILFLVPATGAMADNGLITKPSAHSAKATLDRLAKAITKRGFMVFTTLDHAAAAKSKGLDMPFSTVLVFGNPKLGTPNFIKKPKLAIDLPLKMLVWEDQAGKVWLSYNSGTYLHQTIYVRHDAGFNPKVTKRLNGGLAAITDEATK